jgi:hypothetical protein
VKRLLAAASAALLCATAAYSHHSFSNVYTADQVRVLQGDIAQFVLRNPHSFIALDVPDGLGNVEHWGIEWSSIAALRQAGISASSLKIGERVTVTGNVTRDRKDPQLLMQRIERPGKGIIWEGTVGNRQAPTAP